MDREYGNFISGLVSVIIPVYNVAEYLEECVSSVLVQSYSNLEIILIDDGSKDSSGDMCDCFALQDDRIHVIHKNNEGLSSARNAGLDIARGEFIYFLDSDDIIADNAFSDMLSIPDVKKMDVIITPLQRFVGSIPDTIESFMFEVTTGEDAIQKMLTFKYPGHEACGKLYKNELWDDIRFPVGKLYEDYLTTYRILVKSKKVCFFSKPTYYYRIRTGSIMNTKIGRKELSILDISQEVTSFISSVYPNLSKKAEYLQLITYLKTMDRILTGGSQNYKEEQKRIMNYCWKHSYYLFYNWVRWKDKIKLVSLLINKKIFRFVYNVGTERNMQSIGTET